MNTVDTTPQIFTNKKGEVKLPFFRAGEEDFNLRGAYEALTKQKIKDVTLLQGVPHIPAPAKEFTITSKVGRFTFETHVPMSMAKLVRDTVMGQILTPQPRTMAITDEKSANAFVLSCDSHVLKSVKFGFEPTVELEGDVDVMNLTKIMSGLSDGLKTLGDAFLMARLAFKSFMDVPITHPAPEPVD